MEYLRAFCREDHISPFDRRNRSNRNRWLKLFGVLTLVAAQVSAGFASPPTGAAVCHRPPPYVGDVSNVTETTPFAGSALFRPNDGSRHTSIILLHGSEGGSD